MFKMNWIMYPNKSNLLFVNYLLVEDGVVIDIFGVSSIKHETMTKNHDKKQIEEASFWFCVVFMISVFKIPAV